MDQEQARAYVASVRAVAQLLRDAQADTNLIGIPSTIAGGLEALLLKYGVARIFVSAFAKGLMRVFAIAALFGFVGNWALGLLAERLESYANILTELIDESPSGIIVANGCRDIPGGGPSSCGVMVVSRDSGSGYQFDYGPAGLLVGWGGIWAPGKAYLPDGSLYTGKDRLVYDQ